MIEKNNENNIDDLSQNNLELHKKKRLRVHSKEERDAKVKEYLQSGLRPEEFAEQKGIGFSTLKKWMADYVDENGNRIIKFRKKLREQKKINLSENKNLFKELQVSVPEHNIPHPKKPDYIEIVVNNNVKLRLPSNTDSNYLIQIIKGISG